MMLDEGLIKGIKGAIRVGCKRGHGFDEEGLIPALPLQPPRMAIPQEGNLVSVGLCGLCGVQGQLLWRGLVQN